MCLAKYVLAICLMTSSAFAQGLIGGAIEGLCGNCGVGSTLDDFHDQIGSPLNVSGDIARELRVESLGPLLAEAIRHSRNDARSAGTREIPRGIREQMLWIYPEEFLNSVRYRVGRGGELIVQANSIRFGDAVAVALIDTVIFRHDSSAQNDAILWAHELKHIEQYRRWGLTDFAKRYVRDWRSVEEEAEEAARQFESLQAIFVDSVATGRGSFDFDPFRPASDSGWTCVGRRDSCQKSEWSQPGTRCRCTIIEGSNVRMFTGRVH